jgi:hypothetical protein
MSSICHYGTRPMDMFQFLVFVLFADRFLSWKMPN